MSTGWVGGLAAPRHMIGAGDKAHTVSSACCQKEHENFPCVNDRCKGWDSEEARFLAVLTSDPRGWDVARVGMHVY